MYKCMIVYCRHRVLSIYNRLGMIGNNGFTRDMVITCSDTEKRHFNSLYYFHLSFLPLRFEPISSALRYKKEKSVMTQPFPKFHQILKDAQARSWQVYYNFKIAPRTEARSANTNSEVIIRLLTVCLSSVPK